MRYNPLTYSNNSKSNRYFADLMLFLEKIFDFDMNIEAQYFINFLREEISDHSFKGFKIDEMNWYVNPTVPFYEKPDVDCAFHSVGYYADVQERHNDQYSIHEHITLFSINITQIDRFRIQVSALACQDSKSIMEFMKRLVEAIRDTYDDEISFPHEQVIKKGKETDVEVLCEEKGIEISERDLGIIRLAREGKTDDAIRRTFGLGSTHSVENILSAWRRLLGFRVVPYKQKWRNIEAKEKEKRK